MYSLTNLKKSVPQGIFKGNFLKCFNVIAQRTVDPNIAQRPVMQFVMLKYMTLEPVFKVKCKRKACALNEYTTENLFVTCLFGKISREE